MKTMNRNCATYVGPTSAQIPLPRSGWGRSKQALRLALLGAFLVAVAEMVFMGGPFAAYFYGVYSPLLIWIQSSPDLIWLSAFFVPHLSGTGTDLSRLPFAAPRYLLHIGLASFVIHAVYLYWVKFVRKGVATALLYRHIRHPQYLSLAVAGLGLLFHWPRLINVVLFLVMLFGYYTLARSEELRMERRHAEAYKVYRQATAMLFPGPVENLLDRAFGWFPLRRLRGYIVLVLVLGIGLAASVALRSASVRRLHYEVLPESPGTLVLFLKQPRAAAKEKIRRKAIELSSRLPKTAGSVPVFYILSDKEHLHHLLVDSGMRYEALSRMELPESSWYLVQAAASYPCAPTCRVMRKPTEALGMTALRRLERVYYAPANQGGDLMPLELPKDAFHRHAGMPIL